MSRFAATLLCLLVAASAVAEESRTWEGTWNNKKYGTSGPLKCVATVGEDGTWKATFSGLFKKDPFSYDVEFTAKKGRGQTDLGGTATVSGHRYQWQGFAKGRRLVGEYRSANGYFGTFALSEKKR